MSNPYQSPQIAEPALQGVDRQKLRRVARYQQWVIYALLANIILYIAMMAIQGGGADRDPAIALVGLGISLVFLAISLFSIVAVFLLANELFHIAGAILCGMLMFVPCIALITLLVVNQKATTFLQAHGIKVGFLGVSPSSI